MSVSPTGCFIGGPMRHFLTPPHHFSKGAGSSFVLVLIAVFGLVSGLAQAGGFLQPQTSAAEQRPQWAVPEKRLEVTGGDEQATLARLENARMRLLEAQQNAQTANFLLTRARTRRYPRGEALRQIQDQVAQWNQESQEAQAAFRSLLGQARRQGIGPGPLRPFTELAEQIESSPERS